MSVRTTIDIPDDLYAELRRRAVAEHASIQSLITTAIENELRTRPSRRVTGKDEGASPGSPDRENPYDVLFASR
jgi:hypothetical protein